MRTIATRALTVAALLLAGALCLIVLAVLFTEAFLALTGLLGAHHALGIDTQMSQNYDFVSGVGPMVITSLGFSGLAVSAWRHLNCERPGCLRLGHRHPDHGRPVCRRHYHADVAPTAP